MRVLQAQLHRLGIVNRWSLRLAERRRCCGPGVAPRSPGGRAADYALLGGWRDVRSAVVSGVTSRRLRFPRPWWRGYGLQCCSRISVDLGPKHWIRFRTMWAGAGSVSGSGWLGGQGVRDLLDRAWQHRTSCPLPQSWDYCA